MFAGHIGAGLAIGRAERQVNVGVFVGAAMLLDVLLWVFVLLGWESVRIPPDFNHTHQPQFVFPYSHGLLASLIWSAIASAAGYLLYPNVKRRLRASALIGLAVFSHWPLDALVHRPELPLIGASSHLVGLGLWDEMPYALALEAVLLLGGWFAFASGVQLTRAKAVTLALLCLIVMASTVAGMTVAPAPPSAGIMAVTSIASCVLVCAVALWVGHANLHPRASCL